jgi:starch synthase
MIVADRVVLNGAAAVAASCTQEGGHGLEGLAKARRSTLVALPPGLDYARWSPATDVRLPVHFDAEQREGKRACKARLQQLLDLPIQADAPVVALAPPLGDLADPLGRTLHRLLRGEIQVVAPRGLPPALDSAAEEARARYPRLVARPDLDEARWHLLLAGADLLILDAPRGFDADLLLAALRYGAVPVIRALGLGRDLVVDVTPTLDSGNGFVVQSADPQELVAVVRRAHAALLSGQPWRDTLGRVMSLSCSWEDTAQKLEQIYAEMF